MATLEVTALTKWYGAARGIEDVTFSLAEAFIQYYTQRTQGRTATGGGRR
jgi:hypothetical protein